MLGRKLQEIDAIDVAVKARTLGIDARSRGRSSERVEKEVRSFRCVEVDRLVRICHINAIYHDRHRPSPLARRRPVSTAPRLARTRRGSRRHHRARGDRCAVAHPRRRAQPRLRRVPRASHGARGVGRRGDGYGGSASRRARARGSSCWPRSGLLVAFCAWTGPTVRTQYRELRERLPEALGKLDRWIGSRQSGVRRHFDSRAVRTALL